MKKLFILVVGLLALGAMLAEMLAAALRAVALGLEWLGDLALSIADGDGERP